MHHTSIKPAAYIPKTNRKEWASRGQRIGELYSELLPIIQDIQAKHPEASSLLSAEHIRAAQVAEADGFSRLMDTVPTIHWTVNTMGTQPADGGAPTLQLKPMAKSLVKIHQPKTRAIFEEVNTMLKQYMDDGETKKNALRISDDLEWALNETYEAAKTKRGGQSSAPSLSHS